MMGNDFHDLSVYKFDTYFSKELDILSGCGVAVSSAEASGGASLFHVDGSLVNIL